MKVLTIKGPIEFDQLRIQDVVEVVENGRKVATEYYLGDELVKRTVTIDILMPFEVAALEGTLS